MTNMTEQEARDLEQSLTIDKARIHHVGTIRITDDSGVTETQMLYNAADIIRLLDKGYDIRDVLNMLPKTANDFPHGR